VNLLADFGGQMGLWCGVSFLTCCEFIFLGFETLVMTIKLYLQKKRSGSSGGATSKSTSKSPSTPKKKGHVRSKYEK